MFKELIDLLSRLSPSKQRLIREIVWNLAQLEQLSIPEDHDTRLDYQSYVNPWLEQMLTQGMSHHTIGHYAGAVRNFLALYPIPNRTHIEAYLARTTTQGLKPGTIAFHVNALKSFFNYLADRDITTTNPIAKVRRPRLPRTIREAATPEQVQALLDTPKPQHRQAMLLLMADSGLRVNELATLQINCTNLDRHLVTVIGKGNKARQVPIAPLTSSILKAHIAELRSIDYLDNWTFPSAGNSHTSPDSIRSYMERLCKQAGIPKVTPHQLRHYAATQMLSHGANLKAVSKILGHANTSTTCDTYWHVIDQQEIIDQHTKFSPLQMKGALCQNQK